MKRFVNVSIALVLAYSWTWVEVLKDWKWISESQRVWALIGLGALFVIQQAMLNWTSPGSRDEVEERRAVVDAYLRSLLEAYLRELDQRDPSRDTLPPVRINLMLPARSGLFGRKLVMFYQHAVKGLGPYPNDVLERAFKKGEGPWGQAWKAKDIVILGVPQADLAVGNGKKKLLLRLKSVISVPVLKGGRVVGVLSMDSESPISETRFADGRIWKLVQSQAKELRPLCFFDGALK